MWTAVIVTCTNVAQAEMVQKELDLLVKRKIFAEQTVVLAVEDPALFMGSGSATLNALLLTAEFLSAKYGHQVITADVLENAHILICHHGRQYPYDSCGKGFITLPFVENAEGRKLSSQLVTNFEHLIKFVTELGTSSPPGIWICSMDMILTGNLNPVDWKKFDSDAIIVCTQDTLQYAQNHGIVKKDENNIISDIIYCGEMKDIYSLNNEHGEYPIVAGIVFLSYPVAESLLSLHAFAPVDSCTYMGLDSGATLLQASLYFDVLIAMASDMTEEKFLGGNYSKSYDSKHNFSREYRQDILSARKLIWKELQKFCLKALILKGVKHYYLSENGPLINYMSLLHCIKGEQVIHSHLDNVKMFDEVLIINSSLSNVSFKNQKTSSVIQHCQLGSSDNHLLIGNSCFLSGVRFDCKKGPIRLDDNIGIMTFSLRMNSDSKLIENVVVVLGINDALDISYASDQATFCNKPWDTFFDRTGISCKDLWPQSDLLSKHSLLTARLFPITDDFDCEEILWMLPSFGLVNEAQIKKWLRSPRISLHEILNCNSFEDLSIRRKLYTDIVGHIVRSVIRQSLETSLLPYFECVVTEGWESKLLFILDEIAGSFDEPTWEPGKAARTLACIADLLSCKAGKAGGLRSGPASNIYWKRAFETLEAGASGSIKKGVAELCNLRKDWLKGHPSRIMRVARHYEGAAQILIRKAVLTAKQYISAKKSSLPCSGTWITVECPARVDLQGGWTDTPPICYELGGSVVNIALLIDEKRPIGARIRQIQEPELRLQLGTSIESSFTLKIKQLEDLKNYQHLSSPGSLCKAAIICAEIVDVDSAISLREQLLDKYGGGLEVQSWSCLPQGSGKMILRAVFISLYFC